MQILLSIAFRNEVGKHNCSLDLIVKRKCRTPDDIKSANGVCFVDFLFSYTRRGRRMLSHKFFTTSGVDGRRLNSIFSQKEVGSEKLI
jgi:hypothetical protein